MFTGKETVGGDDVNWLKIEFKFIEIADKYYNLM